MAKNNLMDNIPPDLYGAVVDPAGGRIAVIVGAGCSYEDPTGIPLACTCSEECHRSLVDDGTISDGECVDRKDLSCLADAVNKKSGNKKPLVAKLNSKYNLKTAVPNDGYLIAVALMSERIIASVITLNYDLALSNAVSVLGIGEYIRIIDKPDDLGTQGTTNLYYLHGNANTNAESWILCSDEINETWRNNWRAAITAHVMCAPNILFIGLGTPVTILINSVEFIRNAIPHNSNAYHIDPGECNDSQFFKALQLEQKYYIKAGWCEFMVALSKRVVIEQIARLESAASELARNNSFNLSLNDSLLNRLKEIDLVTLGHIRAWWLENKKRYCPDKNKDPMHMAQLLLAVMILENQRDVQAIFHDSGVVEFRRGNQSMAAFIFISGRGVLNYYAVEGFVSSRIDALKNNPTGINGAIAAGISGGNRGVKSTPKDIIRGDQDSYDIVGQRGTEIYEFESMISDTTLLDRIIPC